MIIFIHQIATSIQADKVVADISDFISRQIKTLFPDKMGEEKETESDKEINASKIISLFKNKISLKSIKNGYLQYIDGEKLIELMTKKNAVIELYFRPGGHLVEGVEIATLYSNDNWDEDDVAEIYDQFVIGTTKTSYQDLEFSIHQMVEIAARALSPGVNDPYTAIACIDNLTSTMAYLAQANFPSKYRYDEEEKLRVIADVLGFEGVLDAAFNQIRQFSEGSTAVIIRLMEAMITIYGLTSSGNHKNAVIKHARMILNLGKRTIQEDNDLQDLEDRARKIL